MRVFGSFDLTGDLKGEVMLVNPKTMTFYYLTSESNWTTLGTPISLGTQKSVPL